VNQKRIKSGSKANQTRTDPEPSAQNSPKPLIFRIPDGVFLRTARQPIVELIDAY
jgi:hypothetical protein